MNSITAARESGISGNQVSKTRQYLGLLVSLAIVAVCLWLVFRKVDWGTAVAAIHQADVGLLALAALVHFASFSLRAVRWQLMLAPVKRISHFRAFGPLIIGFFANTVLPARAGEVIRAHVIGRQEGISRVAAFSSIVAERLLDVAVLLAMALIAIPGQILGGSGQMRIHQVAIVVAMLLATLILAVTFRRQLLQIVDSLLKWFPDRFTQRVREVLDRVAEGLSVFASSGHVAAVLGLSLAVWGVVLFSVWLAGAAMQLDLGLSGAVRVVVAAALGMVVTVAPGGMGTYELASTAALQLIKVPWGVAAVFSVTVHVLQAVPVVIVGAIIAAKTRWWQLRIR